MLHVATQGLSKTPALQVVHRPPDHAASMRQSHALRCQAALLPCRFAGIARLAGKQLEPYVAQMVPKLYRLQVTMSEPFGIEAVG